MVSKASSPSLVTGNQVSETRNPTPLSVGSPRSMLGVFLFTKDLQSRPSFKPRTTRTHVRRSLEDAVNDIFLFSLHSLKTAPLVKWMFLPDVPNVPLSSRPTRRPHDDTRTAQEVDVKHHLRRSQRSEGRSCSPTWFHQVLNERAVAGLETGLSRFEVLET